MPVGTRAHACNPSSLLPGVGTSFNALTARMLNVWHAVCALEACEAIMWCEAGSFTSLILGLTKYDGAQGGGGNG